MRNTLRAFAVGALFLSFALPASAEIAVVPGSPTETQPFTFYCDPYTTPFVETGAYVPGANPVCHYTVPQTTSIKVVAIYSGTVGSATIVQSDFTTDEPASSLTTSPNSFGTPVEGDEYFAASYGASSELEVLLGAHYLQTGEGTAPTELEVLNWTWGVITEEDVIPPLVTISSPVNGATYSTNDTVFIEASANEDVNESHYFFNGVAVNPADPLDLASAPLGSANVSVSMTDLAGNTGYATSTFTIAAPIAPTVVINTPADGSSYLQNDLVFIAADISDDGTVATSTYTLNGTPISGFAALPLMSQPQGSATLVISATDDEGNVGYATSTFTILPPDLTAPSIVITNPVQGANYFDTVTLFVVATITDAAAIAAESYTFNGASIDPLQPLPLLTAPLGSANVTVTATDAYGNVASSTVTFIIKSSDITPPSIVISSPVADQTYLSTDEVFALATVTDASGVDATSYELNGLPINPADPLPLTSQPDGAAVLTVFATDIYGNAASSSVSFTIQAPPPADTEAPVIVITNPKANKLYKRNENVKATATITDDSPIVNVEYLLNGVSFDPDENIPFNKARMGTSTVTVTATDAFGNVGSASVSFRIGPGLGTCITDIIAALANNGLKNKSDFEKSFKICHELFKFDKDKKDKDSSHDGEYHGDDNDSVADREINRRYGDLHKLLSWDR